MPVAHMDLRNLQRDAAHLAVCSCTDSFVNSGLLWNSTKLIFSLVLSRMQLQISMGRSSSYGPDFCSIVIAQAATNLKTISEGYSWLSPAETCEDGIKLIVVITKPTSEYFISSLDWWKKKAGPESETPALHFKKRCLSVHQLCSEFHQQPTQMILAFAVADTPESVIPVIAFD